MGQHAHGAPPAEPGGLRPRSADLRPLLRLVLRTGPVELRLPDAAQVEALADLALRGIHPPERMPFARPWTDLDGDELREEFRRFHGECRSRWSPVGWHLALAVLVDGAPAGVQGVMGEWEGGELAVETGSWLGSAFQGRGIGTLMRAAVLDLALVRLGARAATSGAVELNEASARVSMRLGYRRAEDTYIAPRGYPLRQRRYVITREDWLARPGRPEVEIAGLEPCLPLFGLSGRGEPRVRGGGS